MMRTRSRLRLYVGAMLVSSAAVVAAMACGPGDLRYLTAGVPAETAALDPCQHAAPPKKPSTQVGGEQTPFIVLAAMDVRVDTGSVPGLTDPPVSLDLDNTCSCAFDAGASCVLPKRRTPPTTADTFVPIPCDGDGGRDNVAGPLLEFASALLPVLKPTFLQERIQNGGYSVIVTITGWNGTDNDDLVAVGVFMSAGSDARDINNDFVRPNFDGNDVWTLEQNSVEEGDKLVDQPCDNQIACRPVASDLSAYVSDGTFVAHFPEVPFAFGVGAGRVALPFRDATLIGKVTKKKGPAGGDLYYSEAELVGRWSAETIIQVVGSLSLEDGVDAGTGVQSICNEPLIYEGFKSRVCDAVDLAAREADDGKGKKCTAMSQAVRFKAVQSKLGRVAAARPRPGSEKCPVLDASCGF